MEYKIKVPSTRIKKIKIKFDIGSIVSRECDGIIFIGPVDTIRIHDNGKVAYYIYDEWYDEENINLA